MGALNFDQLESKPQAPSESESSGNDSASGCSSRIPIGERVVLGVVGVLCGKFSPMMSMSRLLRLFLGPEYFGGGIEPES